MPAVHTVLLFAFCSWLCIACIELRHGRKSFSFLPAAAFYSLSESPRVHSACALLLGRFHTCARYSPACSEVLCTECFTSVLAHLGVEPRRWIARSECACISSVAKYCQILLPEYVPFFLPLPKIEYVVRISGFYRFDCWEMAFYHYLYLKSFYHGWDCSSFFYVWVIFASFLSCLLSF